MYVNSCENLTSNDNASGTVGLCLLRPKYKPREVRNDFKQSYYRCMVRNWEKCLIRLR